PAGIAGGSRGGRDRGRRGAAEAGAPAVGTAGEGRAGGRVAAGAVDQAGDGPSGGREAADPARSAEGQQPADEGGGIARDLAGHTLAAARSARHPGSATAPEAAPGAQEVIAGPAV